MHATAPIRVAMDDLPPIAPRAKSTLSNLSRLFAQPSPSRRGRGVGAAADPGVHMRDGDAHGDRDGRACHSMPVDALSRRERDALRGRLRAASERRVARSAAESSHSSSLLHQQSGRLPEQPPLLHPRSSSASSATVATTTTPAPSVRASSGDHPVAALAHSSEAVSLVDDFDSEDDSDREHGGSSKCRGALPIDDGGGSLENDHVTRAASASVTPARGPPATQGTVENALLSDSVELLRREMDSIVEVQSQLALELAALAAEQRQHYAALNELLQENFRATGALESRVDRLVGTSMEHAGSTSRHPIARLGWLALDGLATLLLLVISIVAAPLAWMSTSSRTRSSATSDFSSRTRRSWRFSAIQDANSDHDQRLLAAQRLSFTTIE